MSLAGKRIVVTRALEQSAPLVALLEAAGAEALVLPCIEIVDPEDFAPADEAIGALPDYDWVVFTSVNAVERFVRRLEHQGHAASVLASVRVAAVGPATAAALETYGITPEFVPDEHVGEGVLEGLLTRGVGAGSRVLMPRALEAREVLAPGLAAVGATCDVVPVYRTVLADGDPAVLARIRAGEADAVVFTSPSTVKGFMRLLGDQAPDGKEPQAIAMPEGFAVAVIGPVTARAARSANLRVEVEPSEYTTTALVAALGEYFEG